jgi:predicted ester cyclase
MKRTAVVLFALLLSVGLAALPASGQSLQEKNKASMTQAYEYFNANNWDKLGEASIASDIMDHNPTPGQKPGFAGVRESFTMFRKGFPDLTMTPNALVAEGDWVCARLTLTGTQKGEWMGMKASGKKFTIQGFDLVRWQNGRAVERYGTFDNAAMMMQLGMMPPPGKASGKKMGEMKK